MPLLSVHIEKQLPHFVLNVSFSVGDEIIALFGPSGAGKTTILHCIAGLATPNKGEITLGGQTLFQAAHRSVPPTKKKCRLYFPRLCLIPAYDRLEKHRVWDEK